MKSTEFFQGLACFVLSTRQHCRLLLPQDTWPSRQGTGVGHLLQAIALLGHDVIRPQTMVSGLVSSPPLPQLDAVCFALTPGRWS